MSYIHSKITDNQSENLSHQHQSTSSTSRPVVSSLSLLKNRKVLCGAAAAAAILGFAGICTYRGQKPPTIPRAPLVGTDEDSDAPMLHTLTLDNIEPYLQTGDLLFVRCDNAPSLSFNYVAAACGDVWSHVALIVRHPETGECCVATSDPERTPLHGVDEQTKKTSLRDVFGDEHPTGVGLFRLREYIDTSARGENGLLGVRLLGEPLRSRDVWNLITSHLYHLIYPETSAIPFAALMTSHRIGGVTASLTRKFEPATLRKEIGIHCSGLVGLVYEYFGLIGSHRRKHWRYWLPSDFAKNSEFLPWLVDASRRLDKRLYYIICPTLDCRTNAV